MTPTTITGKIERFVYSKPEDGFAVARIYAKDNNPSHLTAVGPISQFRTGQAVTLTGEWVNSARFGEQLKVIEAVAIRPTTADGITQHLADAGIPGVGYGKAKRITAAFGDQTLDIIETAPERLASVPGLSEEQIKALHEYMAESKEMAEFSAWMRKLGVGPKTSKKIFDQYKRRARQVINENPYTLADDIDGVGFAVADQIAGSVGFAAASPFRIRAGIRHVLKEASGQQGHTCLPPDELTASASEILGLPIPTIEPVLSAMTDPNNPMYGAALDGGMVYSLAMLDAERSVAAKVKALMQAPALFERADIERILDADEKSRGADFRYNEAQREAILRLAAANIVIITGGPGTGKTTILKGIIEVLKNRGLEVNLGSPTGRAAQRMEEATGVPAQTIHRLLGFNPFEGGFTVNEDNPLSGSVIIDETSMLDIQLADSLFKAVPPGTPLILVGDVDQLPSVGPGAVLRDLIAAGVPTQFLKVIMRQAAGSMIISNSHRINRGEMPLTAATAEEARTADYHFIVREDPNDVAAEVVKLVTDRIPKMKGYKTTEEVIRNIQVLAPQRRGETGVTALNKALQSALNVNESYILVGEDKLKPGDKVQVMKNIYDLGVFNGETGIVDRVDVKAKTVVVAFRRRNMVEVVTFEQKQHEHLALAYATTVHKAQGSEYETVVFVAHAQAWNMLARNLIYTGVTRAKKMCVVVGQPKAVEKAVGNVMLDERHSRLRERVQS